MKRQGRGREKCLTEEGECDEKEKKRFHGFGVVGVVDEKRVVLKGVNLREGRF